MVVAGMMPLRRERTSRWSAWDAKIALDQAVEARRKTVANHCAGNAASLEEWRDLQQAIGAESKALQEYHNALGDCNSVWGEVHPLPAEPADLRNVHAF
jgi:hypothetical protein